MLQIYPLSPDKTYLTDHATLFDCETSKLLKHHRYQLFLIIPVDTVFEILDTVQNTETIRTETSCACSNGGLID